MIAIFEDTYLLNRRIAVCSIHAPHRPHANYSLTANLKRCMKLALNGESEETLSHVIFAGDFNRQDWDTDRVIWSPPRRLVSVQQKNSMMHTISNLAYDNVLYSSRNFLHTLERKSFEVGDSLGSDHRVIQVVFRA